MSQSTRRTTSMDVALVRKVASHTMRWNFRMWGFGEAIALRGLIHASDVTGDTEMLGYVHALLRAYIGRGVARSAEEHVAPARELLLLHERRPDEAFVAAAKQLAALHASFPTNPHGARLHRPDLPGWRQQIWVDCMDSEAPFLAHLGAVTGEPQYSDRAVEELLAYARLLQDPDTGHFHHGYETHAGLNGQPWARGHGWALMGLVETLRHLPDRHPGRPELVARLCRLCTALSRTQDSSGLWHTLVTDVESYLESTLAVMTAYAVREAIAEGFLDASDFGPMADRARAAAMDAIDEDGALRLVSDATPVGSAAMYASRPFGVFPWGQGPLLLMLARDPRVSGSPR